MKYYRIKSQYANSYCKGVIYHDYDQNDKHELELILRNHLSILDGTNNITAHELDILKKMFLNMHDNINQFLLLINLLKGGKLQTLDEYTI